MRLVLVLLAALASTGCRHTFSLPYSKAQLRADSEKWPGDALVHYLGQGNAEVEVCGPDAALLRRDDELVDPFVESLEARLAPDRWQACAQRLVPTLGPKEQERAWARLAKVVRALFERSDGPVQRVLAAHEVIASRPRVPSPALEELFADLSQLRRDKLVGPLVPVLDTLLTTLELEQGQLQGRPVTAADVEGAQDDGLLTRMHHRLPDEALRAQAKVRLVRLRIERSPTREVQARAAEVEKAVLATGRWAQPAASLRLERPDAPTAVGLVALAQQEVDSQLVLLSLQDEAGERLAPRFALAPLVRFPVGWSRPLQLCEPAERLSVEPCVEASEVEVTNPLVRFDADGVVHLQESMPMEAALQLAREDVGLVLPVRLGGKLVSSLQVPLQFTAPDSILFVAPEGQPGPSVNVLAVPAPRAMLFSTVNDAGVRRLAVVPHGTQSFEVASVGGRGVAGVDGRRGAEGIRGWAGMNATCPAGPAQDGGRGGEGGAGTDGGPGGPGSDGGFVRVVLRCGGRCPEEEAWIRAVVHSRGGAGGAGGEGGRGGRGGEGGRGGASANCGTSILGPGQNGLRGDDGPRGQDGQRGENGRDGTVEVLVE